MADKEIIKQEIERRIVQAEEFAERAKGANDDSSKLSWNFVATQNKSLLQFIDSLPEPASEDLEEAAEVFYNNCNLAKSSWWDEGILHKMSESKETFIAGAEWQKEKDYKMYAHVPLKDIHDAWQELKTNKPDIENYPSVCFQKGADWRENQIKETLQTEYEKGRFDMREEMMKDAVEGEVVYSLGTALEKQYKVTSERIKMDGIKLGDKVKIIICKNE